MGLEIALIGECTEGKVSNLSPPEMVVNIFLRRGKQYVNVDLLNISSCGISNISITILIATHPYIHINTNDSVAIIKKIGLRYCSQYVPLELSFFLMFLHTSILTCNLSISFFFISQHTPVTLHFKMKFHQGPLAGS